MTAPGPRLRVALLTREYPPDVYGGAGVHVTYLARELRSLVDLTVHCEGTDRFGAVAHRPWDHLAGANPALGVVSIDLSMARPIRSPESCTNFAGGWDGTWVRIGQRSL